MTGGVSEESGTEMIAVMHELHIGVQNGRFGGNPISHFESKTLQDRRGRLSPEIPGWSGATSDQLA